jgi:solute carrier family 10 (sodium/bile acid cotransporter), member 7
MGDKIEGNASRERPMAVRWTIMVLKFLLSQWQVLGIGVAVIFAWLFPNVGRKGGVIESQYVLGGI